MKHPFLHTLKNLKFTGLSCERLADYAYALSCCRYPAFVSCDELHHTVALICGWKIEELRREINRRLKTEGDLSPLAYVLQVCNDTVTYYKSACEYFSIPVNSKSKRRTLELFEQFLSRLDYSQLSDSELVRLHALSSLWYDLCRNKEMEIFTREYFWRIAYAMTDPTLSQIFMLTEYLEAGNYSQAVGLPYNIGERLVPFTPSAYPDDAALLKRIKALSEKPSHLSREELIGIACYIQTEIVETGKTAEHLALVNAILNTGMPCFNYPKIARELEKTTVRLTKSNSRSRIELASAYSTLWSLTLKSSYLSQFEKTVRHCYFTLANDKKYPGLGVDTEDPRSIASAIRFLDANRQILWIMNERYDVDKVIRKYQHTLALQTL